MPLPFVDFAFYSFIKINHYDYMLKQQTPPSKKSNLGVVGDPQHCLAWRIPWTEKPGRLLSMGSKELDMT